MRPIGDNVDSDHTGSYEQSVELRHHTRRLGIEWSEVAERLMALHPDWAAELGLKSDAPRGDPAIAFNPQEMLPLLRSLADGASGLSYG